MVLAPMIKVLIPSCCNSQEGEPWRGGAFLLGQSVEQLNDVEAPFVIQGREIKAGATGALGRRSGGDRSR